jgi:hypothetical protein
VLVMSISVGRGLGRETMPASLDKQQRHQTAAFHAEGERRTALGRASLARNTAARRTPIGEECLLDKRADACIIVRAHTS